MTSASHTYLTQLRILLTEHFSLAELQTLCFDLGIDYETIPPQDKEAWVWDLLLKVARLERLAELVALAQQVISQVAWPPMPPDLALPQALPAKDRPISSTVHHHGDKVNGDKISIGDIQNAQAIAVGAGATAIYQIAQQTIMQGLVIHDIEQLPPEVGEAPYRGLRYFNEEHAEWFFGRERLTATLVNRLHDTNFLAVVGDSGSGKSSVVRAGIVPVLTHKKQLPDGTLPPLGQWQVHTFTPTSRPIIKLANILFPDDYSHQEKFYDQAVQDSFALRKAISSQFSSDKHILFVDQFEELFALCKDENQRQSFIDNLLTASGESCRIIITLRADFYAQCSQYENLRHLLQTQQEFIGAMSRTEQAEAIMRPAARGGWKFQEKLVELILDDVGKEPGALPLMSHALLEMWQRRRGRIMTLSGYDEAGKVRGAIALTAENKFRDFSDKEQQVARLIFLRLTELGEGIQDTRRRAGRDEIGNDTIGQRVINHLADARLITIGDDSIDIAHEVLIHEWPRLRGWIDVDRQGQQIHRRLTNAAQIWREKEKERSFLYQGFRLNEANYWVQDNSNALNEWEIDFLEASRKEQKRLLAEEEEKRRTAEALQTQQRIGRILRWATGIVAVLLIIAVIVAIFANTQRGVAETAQAQAEINANIAATSEAEAISAQATSDANANLASIREAEARAAEAEVQELKTAIQASQLASAAQAESINDSERSLLLAVTGLHFNHQLDTYRQLVKNLQVPYRTTLHGHEGWWVYSAVFSPDGQRLVTTSEDGTVRLWDGAGNELVVFHGHKVNSAIFSPDGQTILTEHINGPARLWDLEGNELVVFRGHEGSVSSAFFSPDGQRIITAGCYEVSTNFSPCTDGTARLWDLEGNELVVFRGHERMVNLAIFSPDGQKIVTASSDGTARLWDGSSNELAVLRGHEDRVGSTVFSPDGQTILTASDDGTARLWDGTGNELTVLRGHEGPVNSVVFSPDGQTILTASDDSTARLWDLGGNELAVLRGHERRVFSAVFSPDGQKIVTASIDGMARLWDGSGNELAVLRGHEDRVGSAVFSPDGQTILTASFDGTARLWDGTGNELTVLRGHEGPVNSVVFSPDGQTILTASDDSTARLWNLGGNELAVLRGHERLVFSAIFSPDEQRILTAGSDGTTRLWDLAGNELAVWRGHEQLVRSAVFSPDGQTILTASDDSTARLWDGSGNELAVLRGHEDRVGSAVFSPDGQTILTASYDGTARLWDGTGNELAVWRGHEGPVNSVVFSPDGQTILTASYDGTARLWNLAGNELVVLPGHGYTILSVAFSPDGQRIVTANGDGTIKLWDLAGNELAVLRRQEEVVRSVVFSPDGQTILTASFDGTARLWPNYTVEYMVQEAFWRIKRGFTEAECLQYFRDDVSACPRTKKQLFAPLVEYFSPEQQEEWASLP